MGRTVGHDASEGIVGHAFGEGPGLQQAVRVGTGPVGKLGVVGREAPEGVGGIAQDIVGADLDPPCGVRKAGEGSPRPPRMGLVASPKSILVLRKSRIGEISGVRSSASSSAPMSRET